jgi:hypothetical protein
MPSETEILTLHLVRTLYDSTDGRPQQWRMLEELDGVTNDAAIYAFTQSCAIVPPTASVPIDVAAGAGVRIMAA